MVEMTLPKGMAENDHWMCARRPMLFGKKQATHYSADAEVCKIVLRNHLAVDICGFAGGARFSATCGRQVRENSNRPTRRDQIGEDAIMVAIIEVFRIREQVLAIPPGPAREPSPHPHHTFRVPHRQLFQHHGIECREQGSIHTYTESKR